MSPATTPDRDHAAQFHLAGKTGSVIPLLLDTATRHHHSKHFHVEFPTDSAILYPIDAARLVAVIGDGGNRRHFSATEVARILSGIYHKIDHHNFLRAIAI